MIRGKKVVIRPLQMGDEEYLFKWWNNSEVMETVSLYYGTLQSKETIRLSITKEVENQNIYPTSKRFIILDPDLKPIGEINYLNWDPRVQKAEFGIKICEIDSQGKGYGFDSLYHFIDFMFKYLNLNKIELTTLVDNKRAQYIYKKLGFKEIGVIRDGCFDSRTGSFTDVIYMDLLKTEWLTKKNELAY